MNRIISSLYRRIAVLKGGETYIKYLRRKGIAVGNNCAVVLPQSISIDFSRPYLIEIGENVRLNLGLTILTHDYASVVFKKKYGEFLPSSGKVVIGNNVYFGRHCTVLKGSTIGDNCIIGYGAVVMGNIPANSVAVGCPAKVVCSLDEYYSKRRAKSLDEAFELAREIKNKFGRRPRPEDFYEEFIFFVSGNKVDDYPTIPIERQLRVDVDCFDIWAKNHEAIFSSFDEFLSAAGV